MEFRSFHSHAITTETTGRGSLTYPLHSFATNTNHKNCAFIMGTATNFVVFDKSFQAASLGDASLIAIVTTIQVLLHAVEELLRRNRKE